MTTDEIVIAEQALTIKRLREKIVKLENGRHPKRSALKVFNIFWASHKTQKLSPKKWPPLHSTQAINYATKERHDA